MNGSLATHKQTKILLIEGGLLGDYCATTGVGQAIRKLFPDARITLLVKKSAKEFFSSSTWLDDILFLNLPWTRVGFAQFRPNLWLDMLFFGLRLRRERFDYVITTRRDIYQHILLNLIGGNNKVLPPKDAPLLYTERVFSVARVLGFTERITPVLQIPKNCMEEAQSLIRGNKLEKNKFILIHPGVSFFLKRWQPSGFKELHNLLSRDGQKIAYIGYGDSDREFIKEIESLLNSKVAYFDLPLNIAIAFVSLSELFIGMDSGFSHISATLGLPTIALYGFTSPERSGISGAKARIINHYGYCFCRARGLRFFDSYLCFCSLVKKPCDAMLSIDAHEVYSAACGILQDQYMNKAGDPRNPSANLILC